MPDAHLVPALSKTSAPDLAERNQALDSHRSFLVQAPAGSGKTQLLTRRFLRLLAQAERPDEIVAITFTNAAAAEMRDRILSELEKAEARTQPEIQSEQDELSLESLAQQALDRSRQRGWDILDQPSQLRILTIDAFCRVLALQSPLSWGLLSGLGGKLDPVDRPQDLYRQAARRTLQQLENPDSQTRESIEKLLLWRDNNWLDVEKLIVEMLGVRNRWYKEFVFLQRETSDQAWISLRAQLELPFQRAAHGRLEKLHTCLDRLPGCREFALELARFACSNGGRSVPAGLAERAELGRVLPSLDHAEAALLLDDAVGGFRDLASFLLTKEGTWRKKGGLNLHNGFPATAEGKAGKERFAEFVEALAQEPGLESALGAFLRSIPIRYTDEEWELVRHCFAVLRAAAGELQAVFAETGSVDFTEVAQIALRILAPEDGIPSDYAIRQAESIRHLLVDEFQDTSRNQHQLLARLIAAWPDREGRTCFCVGDPMQSIYSFREAEVELFERLKTHGLESEAGSLLPQLDSGAFPFELVTLRANFRTAPSLVEDLNQQFERIFAEDDGSGVQFANAVPARASNSSAKTELHLAFTVSGKGAQDDPAAGNPKTTRQAKLAEIIALIRGKLADHEQSIAESESELQYKPEKYRIAVLARAKKSLIPIAEALRDAGIACRAIDLVPLRERPEVLDALALTRALLNPVDRNAWLAVLRAPWCGLSLEELHLLVSADSAALAETPIPTLLATRLPGLPLTGPWNARAHAAASRVGDVLADAVENRASAANSRLGTWVESVWKALGGEATVDAAERENLRLLWGVMDRLPQGELDLIGPALDAALDSLYAQPDPGASSDFGVQLMTIHKSKGLEFEVVIVPDLESKGRNDDPALFSWLERGLAEKAGEDGAQLTEFLIAPIATKGGDASAAKHWVDGVKRERSTQELRRLLYVAATRAREELHLFARPRYKESQSPNGKVDRTLNKPTGLLLTAWPALGDTVEAQFQATVNAYKSQNSDDPTSVIESLAAEGADMQAGRLLTLPLAFSGKPTILRRLPLGFAVPMSRHSETRRADENLAGESPETDSHPNRHSLRQEPLFARSEGGMRSRLLGTAVHQMLEELSRLRLKLEPEETALALTESLPKWVAGLRGNGLFLSTAESLAREALTLAQRSLIDPVGAWILAPHAGAESEAAWVGLVRGKEWNLRPDRVFFAPPCAGLTIPSEPAWWIVDYKTSHADSQSLADDPSRKAFLKDRRSQYGGQLEAYAQVLRGLQTEADQNRPSTTAINAGIYYPRLQLFDPWAV